MTLGIILVVLFGLLALAILTAIIGYIAQIVKRYQKLKNQNSAAPDKEDQL